MSQACLVLSLVYIKRYKCTVLRVKLYFSILYGLSFAQIVLKDQSGDRRRSGTVGHAPICSTWYWEIVQKLIKHAGSVPQQLCERFKLNLSKSSNCDSAGSIFGLSKTSDE